MEYIVGIALIIIVVIIVALLFRKKIYDSVDRLEAWKVDIMNRNIAAELSRMKELNLTGEALEKFDKWKDRWEIIVTDELANVEISLFDSESYADKYKFKSAKASLEETEAQLEKIETDLNSILTQLNELLKTEEESRKGVEELRPTIKELELDLKENNTSYGKGSLRFKEKLEDLNKALITYDELVESGEYHQAKEIVDQIIKDLEQVKIEMAEYPDLYIACKVELPEQLKNLENGIDEMEESGYPVEQLGFKEEIKNQKIELLESVKLMESKGLEESKEVIPRIELRVQEMYDLLEKEVEARQYLEIHLSSYKESLIEFEASFIHTQEEVATLKEAYYFAADDLEKVKTIEDKFEKLKKQEVLINEQLEEKSETLSKLQAQLESAFEQLEQLKVDHQAFIEDIHMLRKDENQARENLESLRKEINTAIRKLRMNNLPGIPEFIWNQIDETENESEKVVLELSKTPLNMKAIQNALSDAELKVNETKEKIDLVIEQAYLTERVIQYANRYRSSHPSLAVSLVESEKLFKEYEYELALETAASAIESVEPGALKNIEEQQQYL